jgi:hypothetical protein
MPIRSPVPVLLSDKQQMGYRSHSVDRRKGTAVSGGAWRGLTIVRPGRAGSFERSHGLFFQFRC